MKLSLTLSREEKDVIENVEQNKQSIYSGIMFL